MEKRQVTLVGGPFDGQKWTVSAWRLELPGDNSSVDRVYLHTYDVRADGTAAYRGERAL